MSYISSLSYSSATPDQYPQVPQTRLCTTLQGCAYTYRLSLPVSLENLQHDSHDAMVPVKLDVSLQADRLTGHDVDSSTRL
jgi:hypothetical protein